MINVAPFEVPDIADAQSGKTGEQISPLHKFVGAVRGNHAPYLVYGQVFALALWLLYLLDGFKFVPRVLIHKPLTYRLVEHGAESLAIGVCGSRTDGLPCQAVLVCVAEPAYHIKAELPVNIRKSGVRTKHMQSPFHVADAAHVP